MANEAGIPIVSVNARIDKNAGDFVYVGSDNYDAGKMEGEYMETIMKQGANLIYLQGTPGMDHSVKRHQAVMDTIVAKRPDVKLLADQTANYDRAERYDGYGRPYPGFPPVRRRGRSYHR